MNAGEVIRKYITDNGIKQNFVAEKIGMTPEILRRSIEGQRKLKADELIAICQLLSLTIEDFTVVNEPA